MSELIAGKLRSEVEAVLGRALGGPRRITNVTLIGGGCINAASRIDTDHGEAFFLKWNAEAPPDLFSAEAQGLRALRKSAGSDVLVPRVISPDETHATTATWLLTEFIDRSPGGRAFGERLGHGLAALHRSAVDNACDLGEGVFGWDRDNYIGSLPQSNEASSDWSMFWRDQRIGAQLRTARAKGFFLGTAGTTLDLLMDRIPEALREVPEEGPSLIHGDLWGGNVFAAADRVPVLIDPAVYLGHREVDLAMSELFGFPGGFAESYRDAWPVSSGYDDVRRPLYQLYYLLAHVNLFGTSYVEPSIAAAKRTLATL